jgi:hypothetical protein
MKRAIVLFFVMTACMTMFGQSITVTSPKGGESWKAGTPHDITWNFNGYPAGTKIRLMLILNGTKLGNIADSVDIGSNGAGLYPNWPVGAYAGTQAGTGAGYKVRIRDVNNQYPAAESAATFSISHSFVAIQNVMKIKKIESYTYTTHSAGTVTIHKNLVCDLDSGHESSAPGCDDFWWMQNSNPPYQKLFIPCDGAWYRTLGVWVQRTAAELYSTSLDSQHNPIPDADLPMNMVVAYQTNYGRRGEFRVVGKGADSSLSIAWVTYDRHQQAP